MRDILQKSKQRREIQLEYIQHLLQKKKTETVVGQFDDEIDLQ